MDAHRLASFHTGSIEGWIAIELKRFTVTYFRRLWASSIFEHSSSLSYDSKHEFEFGSKTYNLRFNYEEKTLKKT